MKTVKALHQQSMDLAESATLKQQQDQVEDARELWQRAFELETQAAALLANEWNAEPTRSVLHRSAATLALRCNEVPVAERLVVTALMGHPPEEIAVELRDLFVQINLRSFLQRQGIEMSELPSRLQGV